MNADTLSYVKEQIDRGFFDLDLPEHMYDGVVRWVLDGVHPGSFLLYVLENNLYLSAFQADHLNRHKLVEWGRFCYWYLPGGCYGCPENVKTWKGLNNV
jgi:hypothetical protein